MLLTSYQSGVTHTVDLCQWAADAADGTTPIEFETDGTTITGNYANGIKLVMRLSGFKDQGDWSPGLGSMPGALRRRSRLGRSRGLQDAGC